MFLLLACTGPGTQNPDDTQAQVDDTSGGVEETAWDTAWELNGTWPEEAVDIPQFSAKNMDGSDRGPADLEDVITVMWFYPAAGTFG